MTMEKKAVVVTWESEAGAKKLKSKKVARLIDT